MELKRISIAYAKFIYLFYQFNFDYVIILIK